MDNIESEFVAESMVFVFMTPDGVKEHIVPAGKTVSWPSTWKKLSATRLSDRPSP